MKCIEYSELISAYVDEMLSPQEEEKLMMHLKTCQACQKELEVLKQMQMLCRNIEEVSLPAQFHEDLMKQLKTENRLKFPIKFKWQYGGALVATMLIGVLFFNQLGVISLKSGSSTDYLTTDHIAEDLMNIEATPYTVQNEVAEARVQDETDSVAQKNQSESRVFMMQHAEEEHVWKVQVENSQVFIEVFKDYLNAEQIAYEQIEEGMSLYQVKDSKAVMNWLQEHSHSFEGSEVAAESNIQLEIN